MVGEEQGEWVVVHKAAARKGVVVQGILVVLHKAAARKGVAVVRRAAAVWEVPVQEGLAAAVWEVLVQEGLVVAVRVE